MTIMPLTARNFNHKGEMFVITTCQQIHKQNGCIYGISIYVETASLQINKQLDPSPAIRIVWSKLKQGGLFCCHHARHWRISYYNVLRNSTFGFVFDWFIRFYAVCEQRLQKI